MPTAKDRSQLTPQQAHALRICEKAEKTTGKRPGRKELSLLIGCSGYGAQELLSHLIDKGFLDYRPPGDSKPAVAASIGMERVGGPQRSAMREREMGKGRGQRADAPSGSNLPDLQETTDEFYEEDGNEARAVFTVPSNPRTLDELIEVMKIDLDDWQIVKWTSNKWEMGFVQSRTRSTGKDGQETTTAEAGTQPLFQIKVWLARKVAQRILVELPPIAPVQFNLQSQKVRKLPETKSDLSTCLVIPDPHIGYMRHVESGYLDPFHDRRCFDIWFQLATLLQPDRIVILGDLLDLPDFSDKFLRLPEFYFTFQPTLMEAGWLLAEFRTRCPEADIDFIPGNHDDRIQKHLIKYAMQIYKIRAANQAPGAASLLSFDKLLGLQGLRITCQADYPQGKVWLNRHFALRHGQEVSSVSGGSAGKSLKKGRGHSDGFGHTHRLETAIRTSHEHDGPVYFSATSFGSGIRIGGPCPGFSPEHDWQNGVGVIWYEEGSDFIQVEVLHIQSGRVIWRGKVLEGKDYTDRLREDVPDWDF